MYNVGLGGGAIYHFLSRPLHKYYINIIIQNMAKQIITVGKKTIHSLRLIIRRISAGSPLKIGYRCQKKNGEYAFVSIFFVKEGWGVKRVRRGWEGRGNWVYMP